MLLWALLAAVGVGLVVADQHGRVVSLVLLVLLAALSGPYRRPVWAVLGLMLAAVGSYLGGRANGTAGGVILCSVFLCGIVLGQGDRRAFAPHHLCGALVFLLLELAAQGVDALWFLLQWLAGGYSSLAGHFLYYPPRWGAHAAGVHLMLATLCLLACGASAGSGRSRTRSLVAALGVLVLPVILVTVAVRLTGYIGSANASFSASNPFQLQMLFVPVAALLVAWATPVVGSGATPARTPSRTAARIPLNVQRAGVILGVLMAGLGLLSARSEPRLAGPKPVMFLDHGGPLSDFRAPTWNSVGFGSAGLYGSLCDLLERSGRPTKQIRTTLEESDLAGIGTVVIIDPIQDFTDHELELLHAFVQQGGGLLVLADHTDLLGMRSPTNQVLAPYGMELRFDTAMETNRAFLGNFEFRRAGVFPGAIPPIQLQLLHGASLRVTEPARPVIVGRGMFGDFGDRNKPGNDGFLGDYRFVPAFEQAGDLVVVASCESGRGRVLAWGDTSTFQNIALARSAAAALDSFVWLEGKDAGGRALPWLWLVLAIVLVAGSLVLGVTASWACAASLSVAALLAVATPSERSVNNARIVEGLDRGSVFLLHDGDLPLWDVDQFKKHSIEGLLVCAAREGLLPVIGNLHQVSDLSKCAFVVIVAQGDALDSATQERLDRYLEGGGVIIVSAGFKESHGIAPYLVRHGLGIAEVPLGAAPVLTLEEARSYKGVRFVDAWPIQGADAENCDTLSEIDGLPVCVSLRYGDGRLVVVGDSWFFTDSNLEGEQTAQIANIDLLLEMMGRESSVPARQGSTANGHPGHDTHAGGHK